MIKQILICDKCKQEKESTYKDAKDIIVFIDRRDFDDSERLDIYKDLCEECYEKLKKHILSFFEE